MIVHAWSQYESRDPDTQRRQRVARETWAKQRWREFPIGDHQLPRLFKDGMGQVPYMHDLFALALGPLGEEDILVFTNADICVRSDCCLRIAAELQGCEAIYSFRRDFDHPFESPIPDHDIDKGRPYCGTDLFAFRKRWWPTVKPFFPDMLLGREAWDAILRTIMDRGHPHGVPMAACLPDLIYHQKHPSPWEQNANRHHAPSQLHCIRLAKKFCQKFGVNHTHWGLP